MTPRKAAALGCAILACCGGVVTAVDGGIDAGADATVIDGGLLDAGKDVATCDAACTAYTGDTCYDGGCPAGSVCFTQAYYTETLSRCYALPDGGCCGTSICECLGACACGDVTACSQASGVAYCNNGPISRRAFKKEIDYLDDARRSALADEVVSGGLDVCPADLYGYSSALLATIQRQQREIAEMQSAITSARRLRAAE